MRFFLLSLVINVLLLLMPLKSKVINEKPKQKIVVTLNLQEKKVKSAPKIVPKPKKIEVKKVKIKPKKKPKKKIIRRVKKKKVAKKKKIEKPIKIQETLHVNKRVATPNKVIPSPSKKENNSMQGKQKKEFCVAGEDFVVLKKPDEKYPRRAMRLRIKKSVSVDVHFMADIKGNINILHVKGGNTLFQDEARKRTKKMQIKLLNKMASKCKIIQPFRFVP